MHSSECTAYFLHLLHSLYIFFLSLTYIYSIYRHILFEMIVERLCPTPSCAEAPLVKTSSQGWTDPLHRPTNIEKAEAFGWWQIFDCMNGCVLVALKWSVYSKAVCNVWVLTGRITPQGSLQPLRMFWKCGADFTEHLVQMGSLTGRGCTLSFQNLFTLWLRLSLGSPRFSF